MLAPSTNNLDHRSPIGGETVVHRFGARSYCCGFELDFGLQPILILIMLEHAVQGAIGGVVIHVRAGAQMGMAAKSSGLMPESPVTVTVPTRACGPETT